MATSTYTAQRNNNHTAPRLGRHHFSYLRAIAHGLDLQACAHRYLGIDHGHQAQTVHFQTVDAVRAVARRHQEPAWRLIGLTIRISVKSGTPTLAEFIKERDLDGWSEAEVGDMYAEAYPPTGKADRRLNLRHDQLALLDRMEVLAAETPSPSDLVTGWFDTATANKLVGAGMLTLARLNEKVSIGGRWYATLPGIGHTKAARIASFLATLLPPQQALPRPLYVLTSSPPSDAIRLLRPDPEVPNQLTYADSPSTSTTGKSDVEAVGDWIAARAGSRLTATIYQREAFRLMLWLQRESKAKTFKAMTTTECVAYMAFLQNIPQEWISRVRAKPGTPGWAPFRGPLSHQSHHQATTIIASMFGWLQANKHLDLNPWQLVNHKTGDDKERRMLDTKALSEPAMAEVLRFIDRQAPSPSRARIRFILLFVEAVGLRSAELLNAKLKDLRLEPEGWSMQIHGKGAKNRMATIPHQALAALQEYLSVRGLGDIASAPEDAPLLSSTRDPLKSVGYQALYEHVKSWLSKGIATSALPAHEQQKLAGATTHWLRHTFGTRAVARGVPLDVIQAQMGHATIQTTASIYARAPIKRRADELSKAFG